MWGLVVSAGSEDDTYHYNGFISLQKHVLKRFFKPKLALITVNTFHRKFDSLAVSDQNLYTV